MDKKRKILNNQQLTNVDADHEISITKLETNKKKKIKKCGKVPKVTIADVMQSLVEFQSSVSKFQASVNERLDKIENRIDKLETSVNQRLDNLTDRVNRIEKEVFKN